SGFHGTQVVLRDILVGDDDRLCSGAQRRDAAAECAHQAADDDDVVAAVAERDVDDEGLRAAAHGHAPACSGVAAGGFRNGASAAVISAAMRSVAESGQL